MVGTYVFVYFWQNSYLFLFKDYVITLDLVEDVLVCVILETGDEEAGWGETAEKLAEILELVRELNLKSLYINKQIYNFF